MIKKSTPFFLSVFIFLTVLLQACDSDKSSAEDVNQENAQRDTKPVEEKIEKKGEKKPILTLAKIEGAKKYKASVVPEGMTVQEKKKRFKALLVPPTQKVYVELEERYRKVKRWIKKGENPKKIAALKEEYKAENRSRIIGRIKTTSSEHSFSTSCNGKCLGNLSFFCKS